MPHSQDILEDLLNELVDLAVERLEQHDTFQPFGLVVTTAGEFESVEAIGSSSNERIVQLTADHRTRAGAKQIDASGICLDFSLAAADGKPASDAICCRLESRLGEALTVYVPYTLHRERTGDDRLELGEMMAAVKPLEIFAAGTGRER